MCDRLNRVFESRTKLRGGFHVSLPYIFSHGKNLENVSNLSTCHGGICRWRPAGLTETGGMGLKTRQGERNRA
jgi:hypothetical protein